MQEPDWAGIRIAARRDPRAVSSEPAGHTWRGDRASPRHRNLPPAPAKVFSSCSDAANAHFCLVFMRHKIRLSPPPRMDTAFGSRARARFPGAKPSWRNNERGSLFIYLFISRVGPKWSPKAGGGLERPWLEPCPRRIPGLVYKSVGGGQ